MDKLKNCPHCGAPGEYFTALGEHFIECTENCQAVSYTYDEALKKWNNRVETPKERFILPCPLCAE